ncbi:hypothetical protein [Caniella muris]|uniref:hypothetical protein n=1 Tax=Caniella muris TaxID=2941502 RepID=UPI002040A6C2|nr:hypothetical protein [Caniella muris]
MELINFTNFDDAIDAMACDALSDAYELSGLADMVDYGDGADACLQAMEARLLGSSHWDFDDGRMVLDLDHLCMA